MKKKIDQEVPLSGYTTREGMGGLRLQSLHFRVNTEVFTLQGYGKKDYKETRRNGYENEKKKIKKKIRSKCWKKKEEKKRRIPIHGSKRKKKEKEKVR